MSSRAMLSGGSQPLNFGAMFMGESSFAFRCHSFVVPAFEPVKELALVRGCDSLCG
jgi:hypothetical protein